MKIKIEKSKIESHIQKVSRLASKHLTLPVLSCVYIEATSQKIILKSTNLDVGLEMSVKADVSEEGNIAVPASVLLGSLQSIKENDLVFESIDNNLKISSGKNSVVIKSMPHDDFPSIPVINKDGNLKSIKINAKDLMLGFRSVWYSASNSNIKPELSSVFVYTEDSKLVFVSTDSFRLAEKRVNTKVDSDFPHTLIPYKNVSEILKIFEDYNGDIDILFDKNQAAFMAPNTYLVSRLVDGSFPDYKQIIPKVFTTTATLLKADLLNSIKASNIFSDSLNQVRLKLKPKDKDLSIEAKNNDVGEYRESLKANLEGDDIEINFNNKYIIDSFQSINGDSVTLEFGGTNKPLIIKGSSDNSFMYMVMPMNR
jgi:DNA polymerase-3 subunit beta